MKTRLFVLVILVFGISFSGFSQFSNWVRNANSVRKSKSLGISTDSIGNVYSLDLVDTYNTWSSGSAQSIGYPYFGSDHPDDLLCISKFNSSGTAIWHRYITAPDGYNLYFSPSSGYFNGFSDRENSINVVKDRLVCVVAINSGAPLTMDDGFQLPSGDRILHFDLAGVLLNTEVLNDIKCVEEVDGKLLFYGGTGTTRFYQIRNSGNQIVFSGQFSSDFNCNALTYNNGVLYLAGQGTSLTFGSTTLSSIGNKIIGLDLNSNSAYTISNALGGTTFSYISNVFIQNNKVVSFISNTKGSADNGLPAGANVRTYDLNLMNPTAISLTGNWQTMFVDVDICPNDGFICLLNSKGISASCVGSNGTVQIRRIGLGFNGLWVRNYTSTIGGTGLFVNAILGSKVIFSPEINSYYVSGEFGGYNDFLNNVFGTGFVNPGDPCNGATSAPQNLDATPYESFVLKITNVDPSILDNDGDGVTPAGGDCNDFNAQINPGALELCDGLDNNCNSQIDEGFDIDGDGFTICSGDCNDTNAAINPNSIDTNDGLDNDCNGIIDDNLDSDGDGYSPATGDCNENNPAINPNALEICDNIDNNCNSQVDEGFDSDNDGYTICNGDCNDQLASVNPLVFDITDGIDNNCDGIIDENFDADGDGVTPADGDCNDANPAIGPTQLEVCNSIDDNCNGQIDEGFDLDNDGYTTCAGDCNDANNLINPGVLDLADGIDNDCDGAIDENFDSDGDGVTPADGDCNDANPAIGPNQIEYCNGIDDNCNNLIDENFDADNDGFTLCNGDCNDYNAAIYPGAVELDDNIDNNCDGQIDEIFDGDGDGVSPVDGDCNDSNPNIGPNALEICNNLDDNCNGLMDEDLDCSAENTDTFVPTGFSPNNDGFNDTWQIPWLVNQSGYSVTVVNRWEQRVFFTNNFANGWDGTYEGERLPTADYYYVITLSDGTVLSGALTIKY